MTEATSSSYGQSPSFDNDLTIAGLSLEYQTSKGSLLALNEVSLSISQGDTIGIVGESGCGKSTLAWAIMRALPENSKITHGSVKLGTADIYAMRESDVDTSIRWKRIAIVPQAAMNVFDPVYTIEDQIIETIKVHTPSISKEKARERTHQLLELVGIESKRAGSYPHQLSGGMKQRAAIAMALCLSPSVLIADEPTTALDVIVQAQIIALLMEIRKKFGMTLILISHDLALVAQYCRRIAIMYAGRIVETGPTSELFHNPLHPYTYGLLQSVPNLLGERKALKSIPGTLPSQFEPARCCSFAPRCQFAVPRCLTEDPPLVAVSANRFSACFEWKRLKSDNA